MSPVLYRLTFFSVALVPFVVVATLIHYNVEREVPFYSPVSMQTGTLQEGRFVASYTPLPNERAAIIDWMVRERSGWKKDWRAAQFGPYVTVSTHRQVDPSLLSVMSGFVVYSCESGVYFKRLDDAKEAALTRLLHPPQPAAPSTAQPQTAPAK
jgi:hypothetical protein